MTRFSTSIYTSWQSIQQKKFTEMKKHLGELAADIFDKKLVLDIGCGSGYFEKAFEGNFIGIDNSLTMLKGQVSLFQRVLGDGNSLPFRDSSFDSIISIDTMHLIQNSDFVRVLKPGGLALLSAFYNDENYPEKKNALLQKLQPMAVLREFDVQGREKEYIVVARK